MTQQGNTIDIKKEVLHIIPSKGFKDAKRYDFLTFDEFPEVLTYDKFRGRKPLYESFKGANGKVSLKKTARKLKKVLWLNLDLTVYGMVILMMIALHQLLKRIG